jgi:hypothetical protein
MSSKGRMRRFWNRAVRRYRYEICQDCGRRVGTSTGSWWRASDELWRRINGGFEGVLCPPCFTSRCDQAGEPIHWEAVPGA